MRTNQLLWTLACLFVLATAAVAVAPGRSTSANLPVPAGIEQECTVGVQSGGNHGDHDSDNGGPNRRFEICHIPRGNPDAARTIVVSVSSLCAHLAHGDTLGPCPAPCGGEDGATCDAGQICQKPEGECDEGASGECVAVPPTCPSDFDPVCGCDGRTYSNECYAAVAGATVASQGECAGEVACGGAAGDTCGDGEFCKTDVGACGDDADGVCTATLRVCPQVFIPVCGCDGQTYDNACVAASAGVNVASQGECASAAACGGAAGDTCGEGEFCKKDVGACGVDAEGVCQTIQGACPGVIARVCGCDGTTYDNACVADAAGVTIASEGVCITATACGGDTGTTCADGEFCRKPAGACGDDATGICWTIPTDCPTIHDPVCGCDGTTYDNACLAAAAGVSVDFEGSCAGGPGACGGTTGVVCDAGQFCKKAEGACDSDDTGLCWPIPTSCPTVVDPVCGCDGTTYDNACYAAAAGVTVAAPGECGAGRVCGPDAGCFSIEFCKRPVGACGDDAEGICEVKPDRCPLRFDPVCGCDGLTYINECAADLEGITVSSDGPCPAASQAPAPRGRMGWRP